MSKPKIALLSLEKQPWLDEMYTSLFSALRTKAYISEITTQKDADEMFASSEKPEVVLVTDAALTTKEFSKQRDAAVQYVRT